MDDDEPLTSDETQAEMDELAASRSAAIGRPVLVCGFTASGRVKVFDVVPDGLVNQGSVPVTPSPSAGDPPQNA